MSHALNRPARLSAIALSFGLLAASAGLVLAPTPAHAATFTVTTTADVVDGGCASLTAGDLPGADGFVSLREAVCVANNTSGADVITLGSGTHVLTAGLFVEDDLTISGAGVGATTIDSASRVIESWPGGASLALTIRDVTLNGGDVRAETFTDGGVLSLWYTTTMLERVRLTGGTATEGGGISNFYGDLTMLDVVLDGNAAHTYGGGGGVFVIDSEFRMQRTTISGNSSAENGAGLSIELGSAQRATIEQSTISGNTAGTSGVSGFGGGLWIGPAQQGEVIITDSTISGNTAGLRGGGIRTAGNAASSLLVSNATVTGNASPAAAGIDVLAGFATVQFSIVAANTAATDPDLAGVITGESNLVGVGSGAIVDGSSGNRTGTVAAPLDPALGALADNGGPTLTHLPLIGSPAIDGAATATGSVDQRGTARPQGPARDVGAVERAAADADPVVTPPGAGPVPEIAATGAEDVASTLATALALLLAGALLVTLRARRRTS